MPTITSAPLDLKVAVSVKSMMFQYIPPHFCMTNVLFCTYFDA